MNTKLVTVVCVALLAVPTFCQIHPGENESTSIKSGVLLFHKDEVMSSFAMGGTLVEGENYQVLTAHRTEAGQVEIHRDFRDVFYIVQGEANIVTGGKVLGENDGNPEEPRGTSIEGGESHKLGAGDVIVIPAGVPHWMNMVKGTLLYFVVKIKEPEK